MGREGIGLNASRLHLEHSFLPKNQPALGLMGSYLILALAWPPCFIPVYYLYLGHRSKEPAKSNPALRRAPLLSVCELWPSASQIAGQQGRLVRGASLCTVMRLAEFSTPVNHPHLFVLGCLGHANPMLLAGPSNQLLS